MTSTVVLDVGGLNAWYRRTTVLRGIDLRIEAGSSVGLSGLNGAGKSTLLGALSGTVTHGAQRLELAGRPLRRGPHRRAAAGLAHVPEAVASSPTSRLPTTLHTAQSRPANVPGQHTRPGPRCWTSSLPWAVCWDDEQDNSVAGSSRCWPSAEE